MFSATNDNRQMTNFLVVHLTCISFHVCKKYIDKPYNSEEVDTDTSSSSQYTVQNNEIQWVLAACGWFLYHPVDMSSLTARISPTYHNSALYELKKIRQLNQEHIGLGSF